MTLSRVGLLFGAKITFGEDAAEFGHVIIPRLTSYFERYFEVHRRQFERSNRDLSNNRTPKRDADNF